MAVVYQHIRLDTNEIFYIGIGKTLTRATSKLNRNRYWKNIINKTEYNVEILFNDLTWEESCQIEKYLIKYYGRKDLGLGNLVNMTDGGDGILNLHKDSRDKISKSMKNNKKFLNKTHTKETKQKLSIFRTGLKYTKEHCENIRLSKLNHTFKNKKVINIKTLEIYDSAKNVAKLYNFNYQLFSRSLCITNNFKNKTDFKYLKDYDKL